MYTSRARASRATEVSKEGKAWWFHFLLIRFVLVVFESWQPFLLTVLKPEAWPTFLSWRYLSDVIAVSRLRCLFSRFPLTSLSLGIAWHPYLLAFFLETFFSWCSLLSTPHSLDRVFPWHPFPCILLLSQLFSLRPPPVPVFIRTTKLEQSTSQYHFVLQSLREVFARLSNTTLHKACATKLAQSTSRTTLHYSACTTKLGQSTSQHYNAFTEKHFCTEKLPYGFTLF